MDKPGGTEPTVPTPTPEENAGKGAVPFFTILEPDEPTDAQKLAEVVREVLTETVAAEGRAALTRLTGRID